MKTEYLDALADGDQALKRAVELLKAGEVVAFPTETVYGLGADVFQNGAIQKIFEAKERPVDNPMIVHVALLEEVERLAMEVPPAFYCLAEHFFPGPLTLVIKRNSRVPALVSAGLPTIAVRMPGHLMARRLIELVGAPLVAPSANRSGRPSPTTAQHVLEDLDGRIAAVLDGGPSRVGIESTVLSLVGEIPQVLRPGLVTREMVEKVLGSPVEMLDPSQFSLEHRGSPGLKHRHYAPRARVRLVQTWKEVMRESSRSSCRVLAQGPMPPGLEGWTRGFLDASTFYAELRRADADGVVEIWILCDVEIRSQVGLMDRITRASAGNTRS